MALLNKLKSILGIGGSRDGDEQTSTSVTVEREGSDRAEPDGDASETDESASDEPTSDEAVAAGTDAAASTGSMTETDEPETETVTETAEAAGPPTEPVDDEPVDRDVEDVIDEAEDTEATDETDSDEPEPTEATDGADDQPPLDTDLTSIKGIGPAYSARLESAGVDSVAALADADAEKLSEQIDVSPKIIVDWIDRAADQ